VEELADRPADYQRPNAPGFKRLLPLSEIIAAVIGTDSPATQAVWKPYNQLIEKYGDEYSVLIDAPLDGMASVVEPAIAQAVMRVREGTAKVTPGYDGVYGQLVLGIEPIKIQHKAAVAAKIQQKSMSDFW
jgi:PHP family Zn ribbon phosphoesterase